MITAADQASRGLPSSAIITAARQVIAAAQGATAVSVPSPPPTPPTVAVTQQMSTAAATPGGATTPASGQSTTGSPIPVPSWVTKTTTTNGVIYWWISGQTITQSGAQVYVPGHWVREGTVTSPTLDQTKVVVAPPNTPEQQAQADALAMVANGAPSFVVTQDEFQGWFLNAVKAAGATDDQLKYLSDEHGNLWQGGTGTDPFRVMVPTGPAFTWRVFTNLSGADAQYNGKTIMLLTPDEANLAKDVGKSPQQWFLDDCVRAVQAKDAADKAAAAAAKQPTTPTPGKTITPIPGSGTSTAATTSATTRNIIIAAAAAAAAYLLLS